MYHVYLGLGSNEGDRAELLTRAVQEIADRMPVAAISSIYETEPVGMPGAEMFLNMAIEVETGLEPLSLLRELKQIENLLGRSPNTHNKPRTIDIDILMYEELTYLDSFVRVPHAAMHRRRFVLAPLAEIAPDVKHPIMLQTIKTLLQECADTSEVYKTSLSPIIHHHHPNR